MRSRSASAQVSSEIGLGHGRHHVLHFLALDAIRQKEGRQNVLGAGDDTAARDCLTKPVNLVSMIVCGHPVAVDEPQMLRSFFGDQRAPCVARIEHGSQPCLEAACVILDFCALVHADLLVLRQGTRQGTRQVTRRIDQ